MSRVFSTNVNSLVANTLAPSDGLVTRFRFAPLAVPESTSRTMAALGILLLGVNAFLRGRRAVNQPARVPGRRKS